MDHDDYRGSDIGQLGGIGGDQRAPVRGEELAKTVAERHRAYTGRQGAAIAGAHTAAPTPASGLPGAINHLEHSIGYSRELIVNLAQQLQRHGLLRPRPAEGANAKSPTDRDPGTMADRIHAAACDIEANAHILSVLIETLDV